MDRPLDEELTGPTYRRIPAIAEVIVDAMRKGGPHEYLLHAWVTMPSHVHLSVTPKIEASVVLHRLKGASARWAKRLLGVTGRPFWQDESCDRLVRSQDEFRRIENYIENPVRAGIATARYRIRRPAASPQSGFAAAGVLVLELGIGVNAAIFAVIECVILRPLAAPEPERLVSVLEKTDRFEMPESWPDLTDLQAGNRVFESSGGFVSVRVPARQTWRSNLKQTLPPSYSY